MRKIKCFAVLLLALSIWINQGIALKAAEAENEAVYDLTAGGVQSFMIEGPEGEQEQIIIEEIQKTGRIANDTYKVTVKASAWTAGFYVDIQSNRIVKAHSPFYSVTIGKISDAVLKCISSTEAGYTFVHTVLLKFNTGVKATINNKNLIVAKI